MGIPMPVRGAPRSHEVSRARRLGRRISSQGRQALVIGRTRGDEAGRHPTCDMRQLRSEGLDVSDAERIVLIFN